MSVKDVCSELLKDLDEDIFEYIVGALEEYQSSGKDGDADETMSMVSSFLESAGYAKDEEAAMEKANELINRLKSPSASASSGSGPQKLSENVKKMTLSSSLVAEKPTTTSNKNTLIEDKSATTSKKSNKSKKDLSTSAYERAEEQALELETELHAARIASIQARTKLGSYKGALDAPSFTLPNPGGGQPLLEDSTCRLVWGRRYGLIGRNGMGKSTLLRALAARRVGEIPVNVTVHYVSQEVNLTQAQREKTPVQCVVDADLERTMLLEEFHGLTQTADAGELDAKGSQRHADVMSRLEEIDADSADRRAKALLDNLGFSPELQNRPLAQLSGGWRVRTMLAAAIFAKPDLLLLDEPTNHLSILAVMWLARELATSETWKQRIIVIVSHDRHFLDEVCSDCLHISGASRRLTQSKGNYSLWARRRRDEQALFEKEQTKRQTEIDALRDYAGHGFKYGGSSSQITKMTMKAKQADKLQVEQDNHAQLSAALMEDMELQMQIAAGGELDGFIVQLLRVAFGYPGAAQLFENCDFGITSKSRIVLLGENGNGKTTLVKLIMGMLEPTKGEVKRSPHARFALVNQHHADQIDLTLTPLQFLQEKYPGDGSYEHLQKLRGHLSRCGVTSGSSLANIGGTKVKDLQNTPASALSGGQRSRVALAAVSYAQPHVLVLDEPTNNLDLESVAALADCVKNFQGAVICVSHDQFFVQSVANEAWVVSDSAVKRVESFEAYRNTQLKKLSKPTQQGE
jgi:ATP-binding cassette subfamily F protein 3